MGTETEILSFKQQQLEEDNKAIKADIRDIKIILSRLENKISILPTDPPQCNIHNLRLSQYEDRLKVIENKLEDINKKIISWTAVASVILFLISSFIIPYFTKHMQEQHSNTYQKTTTSSWNGYPMPSPMPFTFTTNIVKSD